MRLLSALTALAVSVLAGDVAQLTASTFDKFLKENPTTLVKFMAPWCGHCQQLAPEYEAAATELLKRTPAVKLAEVDATEEKDLAEKYNVQGFPTIFLFRDGKPEPYSGGRTRQTIVDWVTAMTGPAVEWLDSAATARELQTLIARGEGPARVAFFASLPKRDGEAAQIFEAVANASRTRGKFFAVLNSSSSAAEVVAQRAGEEAAKTGSVTKDRLTAWVHSESFHLFGEVTPENYAALAARSPNWVWFAGQREDFDKYAPAVRRVSRNYRTDLNFVWLNTDTHKAHAEGGLGLTKFPGLVVAWEGSVFHYAGDITEKGLTKFIEAVKGGKVAKFVKSEPIPEKNDDPVKIVVGKNFADMVLQKDKDVFLKVYAPWCGHCQKLAPVWDQLAQRLAKSEHLMIAKFDGTANEPDVEGFNYEGFPMLFFVPAGAKKPIKYDGDREINSLINFVKKNAKYPIVVDDASKDEL